MRKQPEITDATRNAIMDAFWRVYQQKPIDQISIKEIVDSAGVHRSTFYRYFTDIYDLLNQFEQKIITEISTTLSKNIRTDDYADLISRADAMVIALKEYAPMIYYLAGQSGDVRFRERLREQMQVHFSALNIGKHPSLRTEYLFHFVFSCILSNLNFWYEHQDECPLEEICKMSQLLISGGIPQYVKNTDIISV